MTTSRTLRRRAQRQRAKAAARGDDLAPNVMAEVHRLPPELLAEIHRRDLPFLTRLAFASVCGASGHLLKPEAPWLVLPGESDDKATLFSLADGQLATVRTPDPAMRGHVVLGSSGGWLVTADARGTLRMANPVTGAQAEFPAITTIPFLRPNCNGICFCLDVEPFLQLRFGGAPPPDDKAWAPNAPRSHTMAAWQMRQWFYRKVVLSASPRSGAYAAMLILERPFAVPAFTTAEDPVWRLAPSYDGVEDAIHHDGRFYSIAYNGVVEAWDRNSDTGEFTSTAVAPRLAGGNEHHRKYLVAAPDGRLMVILKDLEEVESRSYGTKKLRCVFKVQMLDAAYRSWEEVADIGDAAVFVGVNGSLCVSTREYWGIRAGCVYFTDDEIGPASMRHEQRSPYYDRYARNDGDEDLRYLGVYSLRDGKVERIEKLEKKHPCWPAAAWVTPSFL